MVTMQALTALTREKWLYYLWCHMQNQVKDYIQFCHSCQITKAACNKTNPRSLAIGAIMEHISLDIMGSVCPTNNDNTVLLVAVERFSHWAEADALPHASAEIVQQYCTKKYSRDLNFAGSYIWTGLPTSHHRMMK